LERCPTVYCAAHPFRVVSNEMLRFEAQPSPVFFFPGCLQVQYPWQLVLVVGAVAVECGAAVTAALPLHVAYSLLRGLALRALLPAALLYRLELGARRVFCGSVDGVAWSWY